MTEFTTTRRRLLAGLGTVGVASAGAGLGTTAYLSDRETFEDTQLTAGQFDLMVDWQVTYTGPNGFEYVTAYPDRYENEDLDTIATNLLGDRITVPDDVRDPIFSRADLADNLFESPYDDLTDAQRETVETAFRTQFADVPQDLDGPILDIEDVKPGDSGAISFSLHLFDNPGYIWLDGGLVAARENGVTEPERTDGQEAGSPSEVASTLDNDVELLDEIRVTVWYDADGDAVVDADEPILLGGSADPSANPTLRQVLDLLSTGYGVPLDGSGAADVGAAGRACFENSTTYYVGFRWELPVDHANEVQSDGVTFDVGFYAEQCRHNDGSGIGTVRVANASAIETPNPGPVGLGFDVENEFDEPVAITSIGVAPTDPALTLLSDDVNDTGSRYGYEVYVDASTPGYTDVAGGVSLPGTIALGSDGYADDADREPILAPGEVGYATVLAFRDGNGDGVDMNGRSVTLTLAYRGETSGRTGTEVVTVVG